MKKLSTTVVTWVGLDAHKKFITVARLTGNAREAEHWQADNTERAIRRLARKLRRDAADGEIRCCYEAGPLGFTLQRRLEGSGHKIVCQVIAPSLIPVKPGDRIKTDRRDARKLAALLRAGVLTEVQPPTPAEESVRDLCRCREDAKQDQLRARHRLNKFLLRRGMVWRDGSRWTQRHGSWLRSLQFEHPADRRVFEDYLWTVDEAQERIARLDQAVAEAAEQEPYRTAVGWLRCFRGIDTLTALTVVAELHGIERFDSARALMSYLGLTPSEHSSGGRRHQGTITKAGNAHVRWVLIEAAWNQRYRAVVSTALRRRRQGQPDWVITQANRALHRLHRKYWRMVHQNKPHGKVVTAVARELVGFLWATLRQRPREKAA